MIDNPPYISFVYAPKISPNYKKLSDLIEEYGLTFVDKVSNGGGLWLAGSRHDELIRDFIKGSMAIGCEFVFVEEARALKHKSGWCHRVENENLKGNARLRGL